MYIAIGKTQFISCAKNRAYQAQNVNAMQERSNVEMWDIWTQIIGNVAEDNNSA